MTKAELEILERNRCEIIRLKKHLSALGSRSPVQAQKITGMPRGCSVGDPVGDIGTSKANVENELNMFQLESMTIIRKVEKQQTRDAFESYYTKALSWNEVAIDLHYAGPSGPYQLVNRYIDEKVNGQCE